ncbi:EAL and HDOD domain-containing protein [Geobacter sp. AOG2]|uniref:EAL and HDOD domain-containing protein n=1 Tax=Geobacter sp. AOG2 TaxID=1566347 RepID=UPI001CC68755|nr:EAL domain-containing protein [Geobacter sp. AOG2]GFE62906.1 cyclic diguanylate phosphodiesterase [Geobacter sp. AOG2]
MEYMIGRQAIVSRTEEVVAYELLFRTTQSPAWADVQDDVQATSNTIMHALSGFGTKSVMGRHRGFVNVDAELLMSDALEILPPSLFGLELLETMDITPQVIDRCRELKAKGYVLALDDHTYDPRFNELYDGVVSVVKIDMLETDLNALPAAMERLREYPVKLLAEKVDTTERYQECQRLGFDLFQGYVFSQPSVMKKRRWDGSASVIFKLMQQLTDDADLDEVERTIKESPPLVYKLLVLVNSISMGLRSKISSLRHAIVMIGLRQLRRWVQLAVFATDEDTCLNDPVMDLAAVRAVFLEELVKLTPLVRKDRHAPDEGYMIGILSILTKVFDISMEEILGNLHLPDEAIDALLRREGDYGRLLSLVELVENLEFEEAAERLEALEIPLLSVLDCQKKAYSWRFGV